MRDARKVQRARDLVYGVKATTQDNDVKEYQGQAVNFKNRHYKHKHVLKYEDSPPKPPHCPDLCGAKEKQEKRILSWGGQMIVEPSPILQKWL